jgi:predicted DsbA family dithiol-disulfide isomerase
MQAPSSLSITASFDLVCPWCLIGKRHLETALAQLRSEQPDVSVSVDWRSVPLLPDTPFAGIPYRDFYVARLGSPEAVAARQAQVQAAAREAGLAFALQRIETFPNTLLAHRLVNFARRQAGAGAASALIENLFARYFLRAENIGDPRILREALDDCRIGTPGPADAPLRHELAWLPPLQHAPHPGGVPHFVFNDTLAVSGAVPPATLLHAMRRALAQHADVS